MEPGRRPAIEPRDAGIPDSPRPDMWLGPEELDMAPPFPMLRPKPRLRLEAGDGAWGWELGVRGLGVLALGGEDAIEGGRRMLFEGQGLLLEGAVGEEVEEEEEREILAWVWCCGRDAC